MNSQSGEGKIELILGPMFSGKTNLLLGAYERATIAHKKVLAFIEDKVGNIEYTVLK